MEEEKQLGKAARRFPDNLKERTRVEIREILKQMFCTTKL